MSYASALGAVWSTKKGFTDTKVGKAVVDTYPGAECYGAKGITRASAVQCGAKMGRDSATAGCVKLGVDPVTASSYCGKAGDIVGGLAGGYAYDAADWVVDGIFGADEKAPSLITTPASTDAERTSANRAMVLAGQVAYVRAYTALHKLQNQIVAEMRKHGDAPVKYWTLKQAQTALDNAGALGSIGFSTGAIGSGQKICHHSEQALRSAYPKADIVTIPVKDVEGRPVTHFCAILPTRKWFTAPNWWLPGAAHGKLDLDAIGPGIGDDAEQYVKAWLQDTAHAFRSASSAMRRDLLRQVASFQKQTEEAGAHRSRSLLIGATLLGVVGIAALAAKRSRR